MDTQPSQPLVHSPPDIVRITNCGVHFSPSFSRNMAQIATPKNYGGYDYSFLDPPHGRYICKVCQLPSRDPYMTGSCCRGQILCKICLDQTLRYYATPNYCPLCRKEGFVSYPNWQLDREIKSLYIYCTNKEKGCEWCGELCDINNHLGNLDGCQYEEVKCSNECGKIMQRQHVAKHVENECSNRKSECPHCQVTGEYQFIEGQHKKVCPKLLVPCPNNCDIGLMLREDLEAHRKECTLEIAQCDYHDVGCKDMVSCKNQKKHIEEKREEHLMMTKLDLTNTRAQLADALKRIDTLESLMHLATDKAVPRPTSSATAIRSSLNWSDKLAAMSNMFKSGYQVCPVIFKLSEFNRRKKNKDLYNFWYSESFYTHSKGYMICIRIDVNGCGQGKGTHLSICVNLMKGTNDDNLIWPLRGIFRIMLLNQINDSQHYSQIIVYDEITPDRSANRVLGGERSRADKGWGMPTFISNKDLCKATKTCQFLKDDSLFFQVDFKLHISTCNKMSTFGH